ncbi:MAG: class I SAM-dependent methyltransferase, partial [Acidimicrobiales bacterium]
MVNTGDTHELELLASRWRRDLASWAIPARIMEAAPEEPWGLPPRLFARAAAASLEARQPTPSRASALEALPEGGSVLDVGAGGGAASLPLAPPASLLVAVDES